MKELSFLLLLIVISVANANAQSTPSSTPVQKNTEVKLAKALVQPTATTVGNNLTSDQSNPAIIQKAGKKDISATKMPAISKEQSLNASPTLINEKKKEVKTKMPPMQNLDSGKQ